MDLLKPSYASGYANNASQSAHPNLWDGLVGAWMPSLGVTGGTLRDVSGHGSHGTLVYTTVPYSGMIPEFAWDAGKKGTELNYDGFNDYVDTTFNPTEKIGNGNDWSVSVWINQPSAKSNARVFGNSISNRFYVATTTTTVFWGFGSQLSTATGVTIPFGQWLHAVFTYNSATSEVRSYRNGVLTAATAYTGNGVFDDLDCQIGDIASSKLPFQGKISNTSIYKRALSPSEIKHLYVDSLAPFRTKKRTVVRVPAAIPAATKVGSIKKPKTIIKPSYQAGYARNASESENPKLWDGLVGAWMPSLGVTGDTLRDVSGNGNHGTLVWDGISGMNPAYSWGAGEKGTHLTFDGINDYVNIGDKISAPKNLSIFSWVKCDNTSYFPIVSKGIGAVGEREYMLFVLSGSIGVVVAHEPTGDVDSLYGSAIGTNKWFYLGMTWDGSVLSVYRNGKLDASVLTSIPFIDDRSSSLRIGRNQVNAFANGKITNTSIYNRALSPQEIKHLYVDSLAPFRKKQRVSVAVPAAVPTPSATYHPLRSLAHPLEQ